MRQDPSLLAVLSIQSEQISCFNLLYSYLCFCCPSHFFSAHNNCFCLTKSTESIKFLCAKVLLGLNIIAVYYQNSCMCTDILHMAAELLLRVVSMVMVFWHIGMAQYSENQAKLLSQGSEGWNKRPRLSQSKQLT